MDTESAQGRSRRTSGRRPPKGTPPSSQQRLVWHCDVCGGPIADDDGYVTVHYSEINAHRAAAAAWDRKHNPPGRLNVHHVGSLLEYPQPVRCLHSQCDPRPDSDDDYWISIERVRTAEQLLDLTAHLLETKNWLDTTTWSSILRRHSTELGHVA